MVRINKFPQNLLMKLKGLIGVQHKTIYVKKKKEVRKNNVRQHSPTIAPQIRKMTNLFKHTNIGIAQTYYSNSQNTKDNLK